MLQPCFFNTHALVLWCLNTVPHINLQMSSAPSAEYLAALQQLRTNYVCNIAFLILAITAFLARVVTRAILSRRFSLDDWAMCAAVVSLPLFALQAIGTGLTRPRHFTLLLAPQVLLTIMSLKNCFSAAPPLTYR